MGKRTGLTLFPPQPLLIYRPSLHMLSHTLSRKLNKAMSTLIATPHGEYENLTERGAPRKDYQNLQKGVCVCIYACRVRILFPQRVSHRVYIVPFFLSRRTTTP